MNAGNTVALVVFVGCIVGLAVWVLVRARRGYRAVQTLMAQVEAHAAADAAAQALAQNRVDVRVGGGEAGELVAAVTELGRQVAELRLAAGGAVVGTECGCPGCAGRWATPSAHEFEAGSGA